jgi:prephenate dehydrogenase
LKKLTIFGVGLIGGSVALALKKAQGLNFVAPQIVGVGRSEKSLHEALKLKVIDALETNIHRACIDADLILIAAPVSQTKTILQSIKPHLNSNSIITDAGSTKGDVIKVAREILGEQFSQFVGGHPIAGAEKSGVSAAKDDLFLGKNIVLTPTPETNRDAVSSVADLWEKCGANVTEMSAENHDNIFAAVSHLPHLLAFALVDDIASRPNAAQLFSFAASGFRDFTRIAGSSPEMWRDISLANKVALLNELSAYQTELKQLKKLLENEDGAGLQALFEHASKARINWENGKK